MQQINHLQYIGTPPSQSNAGRLQPCISIMAATKPFNAVFLIWLKDIIFFYCWYHNYRFTAEYYTLTWSAEPCCLERHFTVSVQQTPNHLSCWLFWEVPGNILHLSDIVLSVVLALVGIQGRQPPFPLICRANFLLQALSDGTHQRRSKKKNFLSMFRK